MRHCLMLALALVGGCARSTLAFDDLEDALRDAKCERLTRCGEFPDLAACDAYFRNDHDASLAAAIAAGATIYDGELGRLCVEALAAQGCNATLRETRRRPQACDRMLIGTRPPDETCEFDRECSSGVCETTTCNPEECCQGTCGSQRGRLNEPCADTSECVDDLYCTIDHECQPLEVLSGPCYVDASCDYGLVCDPTTFPGTCTAAPSLGEPCPDLRCAEIGAKCIGGMCTAVALDSPCADDSECSPFAGCSETKRCAAIPTLGQPCTGACGGYSYCSAGQCVATLKNDESCDVGECTSGLCREGPVFDYCDDKPVCF